MYQRELAFTYRNYSFLELLNVGGSSISRLRVLLPYRLIDLDELKSLRGILKTFGHFGKNRLRI